MNDFIAEQKKSIIEYLSRYTSNLLKTIHPGLETAEDVLSRILEFSVKGKMIRGALARLGCLLFSKGQNGETVKMGAALELFQSALLIHDDIMDRDLSRRGMDTLFYHYARAASEQGIKDSRHTGESLGICAGDIAFFMAFDILAGLNAPPDVKTKILSLCSREMSLVGAAQMMDVLRNSGPGPAEADSIILLYRYKTGRYTFALPLAMGALLASAAGEAVEKLMKTGETLGIIFQIKDDELGLFGDETTVGKPVGSDIKEGKKTLHFHYLIESADAAERNRLASVFGNRDLSGPDMKFVRELMVKYGVTEKCSLIIDEYSRKAEKLMKEIPFKNPDAVQILQQIIHYNVSRKS
ncbi:MAG: polyprenyl synthetase family protein [Spirochaetales bacterium]|nr:polyprenyl synthetase family protein [Spirochaetales bacterium]